MPAATPQARPPGAKNYAQGTGNLTSCQKQKVFQRYADDFVNDLHYTRIAANLPDAGKHRHRGEKDCNHQICNIHGPAPSELNVIRQDC
jgi:hypothetical protein